jgi:hypothetical protein
VIGIIATVCSVIFVIFALISIFTFFGGFRRCYSVTKAKRWMLGQLKEVVKEYKENRDQ